MKNKVILDDNVSVDEYYEGIRSALISNAVYKKIKDILRIRAT